ncbi:MAG: ABC transporter [Anaerolineaceae bacterium]|nr:MAG: ABC transporter [Anaerolineaceae bacterium]
MEQNTAILTEGLVKNYGPVKALRGVNLEVRRGEIFGFLGPNGAGKTTTIRCLLDMIRPNGGTIRVLGLDPQRQSVQVRARAGYLPGELAFEGNMTVEAGLRYLASLRGGKVDWGFAHTLAKRLELDLKPQFKNLSKGNKQKFGLVQALMHQPELLLLDEPTAGLDPLMQREVLKLLHEMNRAGATIFFSSHIISEVEQVAARVGIIRQGLVVEIAETQALVKRALRRARVRFGKPAQAESLENVAGVKVLNTDGDTVHIQIEGEMDALLKALAKYTVCEFETERPSLEEIFLAYYADKEAQ